MGDTPSKSEIAFSVQALRDHSQIWFTAQHDLEAIGTIVSGLDLNRVEVGLFQHLVSQVNSTRAKIQKVAQQGVTETQKGGAAMLKVAATYEQEEANNTHKMEELY